MCMYLPISTGRCGASDIWSVCLVWLMHRDQCDAGQGTVLPLSLQSANRLQTLLSNLRCCPKAHSAKVTELYCPAVHPDWASSDCSRDYVQNLCLKRARQEKSTDKRESEPLRCFGVLSAFCSTDAQFCGCKTKLLVGSVFALPSS